MKMEFSYTISFRGLKHKLDACVAIFDNGHEKRVAFRLDVNWNNEIYAFRRRSRNSNSGNNREQESNEIGDHDERSRGNMN
jgi:3'-phosphoadenosine 5'-phosphosulfate sulfotransferase